MLCFRDRTFCTFYKDCADKKTCSRPLTPAIRQLAKEWWGGEGAPICQFNDKPSCHRSTENECQRR